MSDNKLIGIVMAVSKLGTGIRLQTKDKPDGEWWNVLGTLKEPLTSNLKGCEIEITIQNQEEHKFSGWNMSGTENVKASNQSANVKTPLQLPLAVKGTRLLSQSELIVRQNCGGHASQLIVALINNGKYPDLDLDKIKDDWQSLASYIEGWDYRGDSE